MDDLGVPRILYLLKHYLVVGIANVASSERVEKKNQFDRCDRNPLEKQLKSEIVWVPVWKAGPSLPLRD